MSPHRWRECKLVQLLWRAVGKQSVNFKTSKSKAQQLHLSQCLSQVRFARSAWDSCAGDLLRESSQVRSQGKAERVGGKAKQLCVLRGRLASL